MGASSSKEGIKNVWIDHVKISSVGRQMIVVHYGGAAGLTISNSDFDGKTKYSASCDGHHYWGFLIYGSTTRMSLLGNYIHSTSGRSPKIGGESDMNAIVHAANNYFEDNTGHAFDVRQNAYVLAEGNYFSSVKTPNMEESEGSFFVPATGNECKANIGRDCEVNVLTDSGKLAGYGEDAVGNQIKTYQKQIGGYAATAAAKLSAASGNFGVGALGSSVEQPSGSGDSVAQSSGSGDSANTQQTQSPSATQTAQETSAPAPATNAGSQSQTEASSTRWSQAGSSSSETSPSTESPDSQSQTEAPSTQTGSTETPSQSSTASSTSVLDDHVAASDQKSFAIQHTFRAFTHESLVARNCQRGLGGVVVGHLHSNTSAIAPSCVLHAGITIHENHILAQESVLLGDALLVIRRSAAVPRGVALRTNEVELLLQNNDARLVVAEVFRELLDACWIHGLRTSSSGSAGRKPTGTPVAPDPASTKLPCARIPAINALSTNGPMLVLID